VREARRHSLIDAIGLEVAMNVAPQKLRAFGFLLAIASSVAGCNGEVGNNPASSGGTGSATGGTGTGGAGGGSAGIGTGGTAQTCDASAGPTSTPIRRLTEFEYNNTLRDLAKAPATELPAEDLGNLFGNDAATQSVPPTLIDAYNSSAASVAASLTTPARIGSLAACASAPTAATEAAGARTAIEAFVPKATVARWSLVKPTGWFNCFKPFARVGNRFRPAWRR